VRRPAAFLRDIKPPTTRRASHALVAGPRSPQPRTHPRPLPHLCFKRSIPISPAAHRTQPCMKLPRPRHVRNIRHIHRRDPAPRHHHNPPPSPLHQLRNAQQSLRRRPRSTRRQQSRRSGRNNILQRRQQVRTHIKCAMERHRHRPCPLHQHHCPRNIHAPIHRQYPKHNAIHPRARRHIHRALHLRKLRVGINKIPAPRPHHRKYRHVYSLARLQHQSNSRRQSSNPQIAAQFNPRRPGAFRRNGPLRVLDRYFQNSRAFLHTAPLLQLLIQPHSLNRINTLLFHLRRSTKCTNTTAPPRPACDSLAHQKTSRGFRIPSHFVILGRTCVKENVV